MTSTTAKLVFIIGIDRSAQSVGTSQFHDVVKSLLNQLFVPISPIQA